MASAPFVAIQTVASARAEDNSSVQRALENPLG